MARKPRVEGADAIFHIATRGVATERVFTSVADRRLFGSLLSRAVETFGWRCVAYVLLGTHYHLIVETPRPTLATGMHWLNGRYAQEFNRRHDRRGHLFGDRYFSAPIESQAYLDAAHRYVALNPVRAGLCASAADWRWGSFRALAGLDPAPAFLDVSHAFFRLDLPLQAARAAFTATVANERTAAVPYLDGLSKYVGV